MEAVNSTVLGFLRQQDAQKLLAIGDFEGLYSLAQKMRDFQTSPRYIGDLTTVLYRAQIDPLERMTKIPEHFLAYQDIQSFVVPDHITEIGGFAFVMTPLQTIEIPASVKVIDAHAFSDCVDLKNITFPEGEVLDFAALSGCKSLEWVSLPNTLSKFGQFVFYGCTKLEDIYYSGTRTQFSEIERASAASIYKKVTIHCTDGDIRFDRKKCRFVAVGG